MINYTEIANYEEQILPRRIYRYQIGLQIPLANIENLEKMLEYFGQRLRQKLDLQSLRVEKVIVSEAEQSELLIYFSLNQSEARSIWTAWGIIDQELAPIGKAKLLSAYVQAPQLPVELGQPEANLVELVKTFLDQWGTLIELVLLIVIIAILLSEKKE
ncbi:hypothetical protein ES702_01990 [subsurface metagenome]